MSKTLLNTTSSRNILLASLGAVVFPLSLPGAFGAGLVLNQIGGAAGGGDLSVGATVFAKDLIGNGAFAPTHTIPNANDGVYGNPNSWIGNSADSFVGLSFGAAPVAVGQIAWGRDNAHAFFDRSVGLYTVQFTTTPNPDASTPDAAWTTIGTVNYEFQGVDSVISQSQRHLWSFSSVNATGIRIITAVTGTAIDELEAFSYAAAPVSLVGIGAVVNPGTNVALSANGGLAFARDVLGNGSFAPTHTIPNLNDGIYGNANSWIGDTEASFAGVRLASAQTINGVAFGRDNTGGFPDRATGDYLIQYTTTSNPDQSTPDGAWTTIGAVHIDLSDPTPTLRHEYAFADIPGVTGVRVFVPGNGIGNGRAIDELEVFAAPVPEPAQMSLLAGGLFFLTLRRRASCGRRN